MSKQEEKYEIDANVFADMLASHCSGREDSLAEQEDLELANALIRVIDRYYDSPPEKRVFQVHVKELASVV